MLKYLYHSSPNKNLNILKPKAESIRDSQEGPVVFATQDKPYASCFLTPTNSTWVKISKYSNSSHPPIYLMCISDEERFKKLDNGGAIYYLLPNSFSLNKSKSLIEWTSRNAVVPIKKEVYNNSLNAMIENDVVIYFCNSAVFLEIQKNPKNVTQTMDILKKLKSENEKRGLKNPIYEYY
jgi:hypothetical protein